MKPETNEKDRTAKHQRKVQAYLSDWEMRMDFISTAKALGMSESSFLVHLFKLYKRGQLKPPDEARRPA